MPKIIKINLNYELIEKVFNDVFENKKNKFVEFLVMEKYNAIYIIYEEVDDDKEVKNIKDFIIETVHEEVKSIRDIFQSFIDLKK